jgi:hypothetical protein
LTVARGFISDDPQAKFNAATTLWNPATGATNAAETFVGYHGTSSVHVDSILEEINPPANGNFGGYAQLGEGFYTSTERETAEYFANVAARNSGGDPAIVEIYARNFDQMNGVVVEPHHWNNERDYMPPRYIDNYDMNVAPVAGFRTGWQVKFNPRAYRNLVAHIGH